MKQLFFLAFFLVGCTNNNMIANKDFTYDTIKDTYSYRKKEKKLQVIEKKVTISKPKPVEVARVCVDKQGKMHNCNYKIPKPYKESFDTYNQIK